MNLFESSLLRRLVRKMLVKSMPDEIKTSISKCQAWKETSDLKRVKTFSYGSGNCRISQSFKSGRILECAIGLVTSTLDDAQKRHAHSPRRWNAAYQPLRTWVCYDGTVWIDSPKGRPQAACGWSLVIPLSQIVNASVCTDGTHACYLRSCHVYFSMNSHWSMRLHLSLPLFNLFLPSYYIIISFLLRYLLLQYCMKLWSCK